MDPAIIHYSKHNDSYLNDQEFGEYFIGLNNKENKNTLNGDKQNINNDNNYINNHSNNNIDINVNHNNNNHESSEILTPLNINTKLSFTERTEVPSALNTVSLYQLSNDKKKNGDIENHNLPSNVSIINDYYHKNEQNQQSSLYDYHYDHDYQCFDYYNQSTIYNNNNNNNNNGYYDNYYNHGSYHQHHNQSKNRTAPRFNNNNNNNNNNNGRLECKFWFKGAICKNGGLCRYHHDLSKDIVIGRKRVTNYKTKPCVDPGRGLKCEYGDRCNFSHPGQALRRPMPIEYNDKQYFRLLLRDCPTHRYPFGIFV